MTIDEYKQWIRCNEQAYKDWCHKKWITVPTGITAVIAWIDFWSDAIKEEENRDED